MTPLVTIIIPAYNAEKFITDAIESAIGQAEICKEIIVVDDGSTDQTYNIAKKFEGREVRVFTQTNQGAGAARNKGLRESKGKYIQFLDADDLLNGGKIVSQLKVAETQGQEFLYSGKWKLFYGAPEDTAFNRTELWKDFVDPSEWLVVAWTTQVWMHPSSWLVPRHLIEKAGPWDESLSLHDDGEFFCRVLLQSRGVKFCDEAESYYRKGVDGSLSSILSEQAVLSHFRICQLYEKHLLGYANTSVNRSACAANYHAFQYTYFPKHSTLRREAKKAVDRLGGSKLRPGGTELFHMLRKFVGWRVARVLENFYYSNGLSRTSLKRKFKRLAGG